MTLSKQFLASTRGASLVALFLIAFTTPGAHAATIWNGPNVTYTKSGAAPTDVIIPGKVVLKRDSSQVLYNTAAGETFPGAASPANTLWAFGTLNNFATLSYQSLNSMRDGNLSAKLVGKPMVVHIVSEDIYFSITFSSWGRFGSGSVSYTRSTAPAAAPPTATLTAPAAGTILAAPASFTISANATVASGTITDVEFFAGTTSLGHDNSSPYSIVANLPNAGSYDLKAVATANGLTGTSPIIAISVVNPIDVSLGAPSISRGLFTFSFTANPGLSYVIQKSSDLSALNNWSQVSTRVATGASETFSETFSAANAAAFYRVGRLPNPTP